MKSFPLVLLALVLSACASGPQTYTYFTNPSLGYNEHQQHIQDQADCSFRVNQAMVGYRINTSTVWGAAIGRANANSYAETMFQQCMISKGWKKVVVEIPR
jgi:hypothetical protein